ncbi:MAG: divalent-cation tolerance protein CutA [Deltaproteobacteria bacterium]|nr:divalent-cation tolerance protein CutA [Deltaproteobacteria bacterium]MCL5793198.1 divalent-cation tolerance protein CutA [Deltaproteobacteria bacterium]
MRLKEKNNKAGYVIVYTTVERKKDAIRIAKILVKERLSACVNIVYGLNSIYRWKGKMVNSKESLLIIKTHRNLLSAIEKRLIEIHPYELPEFISVDIKYGLHNYLKWINDNIIK